MSIRHELQRLTIAVLREDGHQLAGDEPSHPLDAVDAARRLYQAMDGVLRDYAAQARGAGASWKRLAEPLGLEVDDSEAAYERVAPVPSMTFDPRPVFWTCSTCRAHVGDYGPYNHPSDNERGHAPDCSRHLADIERYHQDR
jgi:hypothetical protein